MNEKETLSELRLQLPGRSVDSLGGISGRNASGSFAGVLKVYNRVDNLLYSSLT